VTVTYDDTCNSDLVARDRLRLSKGMTDSGELVSAGLDIGLLEANPISSLP